MLVCGLVRWFGWFGFVWFSVELIDFAKERRNKKRDAIWRNIKKMQEECVTSFLGKRILIRRVRRQDFTTN